MTSSWMDHADEELLVSFVDRGCSATSLEVFVGGATVAFYADRMAEEVRPNQLRF
jgi:hypothetical protein